MIEPGISKFTRWFVIAQANSRSGMIYWLCRCQCGTEREIPEVNLTRGYSKSCGCLRHEPRLGPGIAARNRLKRSYENNAETRNLKFLLTDDEFDVLTSSPCHYCGVEPKQIQKDWGCVDEGSNYTYNGIDRKDNDKDYLMENCVPCCKICNRAKDDLTYEEFMEYLQRIIHEQGV